MYIIYQISRHAHYKPITILNRVLHKMYMYRPESHTILRCTSIKYRSRKKSRLSVIQSLVYSL